MQMGAFKIKTILIEASEYFSKFRDLFNPKILYTS